MSDLLFVYGTLRPDLYYPRSSLHVGKGQASPRHLRAGLYNIGPYLAAILSDDPSDIVERDVFGLRNPDAPLQAPDEEEGCPS